VDSSRDSHELGREPTTVRRAGATRLGRSVAACFLGVLGVAAVMAQSGSKGRRPFEHRNHVPKVWADGSQQETLRDCRGCHVFEEHRTRDPQAVCNNCHIRSATNESTFTVVFAEGWETLEPHRRGNPFDHYGHRALACRECHEPEGYIAQDPMPVKRGFDECVRCHGPSPGAEVSYEVVQGQDPVDPARARRGFLALLNEHENMRPDRLGPFLHSEHLSEVDQPATLARLLSGQGGDTLCTTCHAPIPDAGVEDLHAQRFRGDTCGECHISSVGPLEFAETLEVGVSRAASTFSHAQHSRFGSQRDATLATAAGYERIEREGCHACHEYDEAARTFVVKATAGTHEGCLTCHAGARWEPAGHGDWEAQGCTACHAFDGRSLLEDRPTVPVRRRRVQSFVIEKQVHPHISGNEDPTLLFERSCSECHRGRIADLPSRLMTRSFSHATHLPPSPTAEHCSDCHAGRIEGAESSAMIGAFLAGRPLDLEDPSEVNAGLSYDLGACGECHRGDPPQPLPLAFAEVEPLDVIDFSHAGHLGKTGPDGVVITCLSCHDPRNGRADRIGIKSAAETCVQCHDHGPGPKGEISGGVSPAEAATCARCHVGPMPVDGVVEVQRSRIQELVGDLGQHHPEGRACSECHRTAASAFASTEFPTGDHVFAEGGYDEDGRRDQHHDGFLREQQGVQCFDCHWRRLRNFQIESPSNRLERGSDLDGWPGKDYAQRFAVD